MAGAVKLSHIPYGFFEKEMWSYFSQFGRVQRLKLFRSTKTGNSKGFAFVQFVYESVAKIVAETMNNYLMFDKLLKCEFIPESKIQPSMFKNWRRVIIPKLGEKRHTRKVNSHKDEYQEAKARCRLYTKLVKRNEKCKQLGINYQFQIPADPHGKPELRRLLLNREPKSEEDMKDHRQAKRRSVNNTITSQSSAYSFIVDSSDDEIELKTPPQTIKRRKKSKKDEQIILDDSDANDISVKDEPLSGDDEDEESATKKATSAADFIKFSTSESEPVAKKKSKKKADTGEVTKFRKMKRYFGAVKS